MAKIIFYADLHHQDHHRPPIAKAPRPNSINMFGDLAIPMQRAISAYAERENISIMLHGGDESTFITDPNRPTAHFDRATEIANVIQEFKGTVIRAAGNHDPLKFLKELGFTPNATITTIEDSNAKIITCQPILDSQSTPILYQYPDDVLPSSLHEKEMQDSLLLTMAHFAFDRTQEGYPDTHFTYDRGYGYQDNTEQIKEYFRQRKIKTTQGLMSLHGHEHRFRFTEFEGFPCLTMPSIVQEDPLRKGNPCGLLAEIDLNDKENILSVAFKQIHLNDNNPELSIVKTVSQEHMQDYYYRPYVPHVT